MFSISFWLASDSIIFYQLLVLQIFSYHIGSIHITIDLALILEHTTGMQSSSIEMSSSSNHRREGIYICKFKCTECAGKRGKQLSVTRCMTINHDYPTLCHAITPPEWYRRKRHAGKSTKIGMTYSFPNIDHNYCQPAKIHTKRIYTLSLFIFTFSMFLFSIDMFLMIFLLCIYFIEHWTYLFLITQNRWYV